MRLKIDVMEREWKNLEFGSDLNKALSRLVSSTSIIYPSRMIHPICVYKHSTDVGPVSEPSKNSVKSPVYGPTSQWRATEMQGSQGLEAQDILV